MPSRNPVFRNSKAFSPKGYASFDETAVPTASADQLERMYSAPPATSLDTGRMSIDDVVVKTGILFAVLLPAAVVGWLAESPILLWGGLIAGLVLGLVVSFKQSTSPALILPYAAAEGLFLGGISWVFEQTWPGIVVQAILGTLAVFAAALIAYRSGKIRVTPKFRRTVLIAMGGYLLFGLVNLVVIAFGGGGDVRSAVGRSRHSSSRSSRSVWPPRCWCWTSTSPSRVCATACRSATPGSRPSASSSPSSGSTSRSCASSRSCAAPTSAHCVSPLDAP